MAKIIKVIEGSASETERALNAYVKDGYTFDLVSQSAFQRNVSGTWWETRIITTIYLNQKTEI